MDPRGIAHGYKLPRVFHRQCAKHDRVNHGKDRGVGADAERKRQHGYGRESGILPQHAQAEAQVLNEAINGVRASRVAAFLFCALHAAKLDPRAPQCLRARHAAASQVFRECLDVEAQLRVHLAFHPRPPRHRAHPRPDSVQKPHTSSGVLCRIPAMTSAMRFHFSASVCNLRFPAAVSL